MRCIDALRPEINSAAIEVWMLLIRRWFGAALYCSRTQGGGTILGADYFPQRNQKRRGFFFSSGGDPKVVRDANVPD